MKYMLLICMLISNAAIAQETPKVMVWVPGDGDPAIAWEWKIVGAEQWNGIFAVENKTDVLFAGTMYPELNFGIVFYPAGIFKVEMRRATVVDGVLRWSSSSNFIDKPSCFDVDTNNDGGVGGADFLLLRQHHDSLGSCQAGGE